jgi:hypothetical protein
MARHGGRVDEVPCMSDASTPHPYRGGVCALLTRHGKEQVIAPVLADALDLRLFVVDSIDTDTLGTFTGEVPRAGTQLEAARAKARLALTHGGVSLGLGSEGAFVSGPFGLGACDVELVVLIDAQRGIEIVGRAEALVPCGVGLVDDLAALHALAARLGFPSHGLVLRPDHADDPRAHKGLRAPAALEEAFHAARRLSTSGRVYVEPDLRAHHHPTRMQTIAAAARDLAARMVARCPACSSPGHGRCAVHGGLPCEWCGTPTREPMTEEYGCVACGHRTRRPYPGPPRADPARCDVCNP